MAFQVTDDILDYTGTEDVTGKPSGHDLREHKVTLPLIVALREFDREDRLALNALFADPEPDDDVITRVVEATRARGGIEYARRRARDFAREAHDAIADLPESPATTALRDAVSYVVGRRQ